MSNPLVTYLDTALAEDHRRQLLAEVAHRRAVATANTPAPAPSARRWHPLIAFPADAWTAVETAPLRRPKRRLERLRLGSAHEWLRWLRTYAILWLAGVVFYLLLAAGAFLADGALTWSP